MQIDEGSHLKTALLIVDMINFLDFKEGIVPSDAIASNTKRDNDYALSLFKNVFGLSTPHSNSIRI